jgi:glycosyltransferase involved in cell wall biosynthesis
LYNSLEKLDDVKLYDIDVSERVGKLFFIKLLNIKYHKGKVKSKYKFSTAYLRILEENLINKIKTIQGLDAIIEMGDIGIAEDIPFYLYQDLSLDSIIKYFQENNGDVPGWELFNLKDLYRRKEWQMKVYEKCAGVFTMSRWLADSLIRDIGLLPGKIHVVNAGINVKPVATNIAIEPKSKKDKIILFIGRHFFRKGGSLVVKAFKLLRKNYSSNIKLVIAGPESWPLGEKIPEGIIFLGDSSWETLRKYYMIADVFCMPSYFEGFGIVFTEALSFGIPCIGRNIQGMSEIIKPGVNGYLLNSDSSDELAELIIKIIEDDKMKSDVERMSKSCQDFYSWDRIASDMIRIITHDQNRISQ